MPQFDQATFLSQIFWCFFGFISLYLILLRGLLPSLATSLKLRNKWFSQVAGSSTASADSIVASVNPFSITVDFLFGFLTLTNEKLRAIVFDDFHKFESSNSILKKIDSSKFSISREAEFRQAFRKKSVFLAGMKSFKFV